MKLPSSPSLLTRSLLASALLFTGVVAASAASTDLLYQPSTSAGHDFNHAPVGQSFTATASNVRGGLYLADQTTFTYWLSTVYPGQIAPGSYPFAVAPSITVRIDLLAGEGPDGAVLHSTTRVLAAPFIGFVDVDYGAAGVNLRVGAKYTILLTDISGQSYPQGVSGWVVPAVTDSSGGGQPVYGGGGIVGYLPAGAYANGLPILQGVLITDDAGIGDNAFQVLDNVGSSAPQPPTTPLAIPPTTLPNGTVGVAYSAPLTATGGTAPYSITVTGLPGGLGFDGDRIVGTPAVSGVWSLAVTASDASGSTASTNLTLTINAAPNTSGYTVKDEGKGTITAVGNGYLMVGTRKLIWNGSTQIIVNTPSGERRVIDAYVKAGMKAQWKGLRKPATNTVLTTKLEIN